MTRLIDKVRIAVEEVASDVILPYFRNLKAEDIGDKGGPYGLVTIADQKAEAALAERLTQILPGSVIYGEEGFSADAIASDALLKSGAPVWIIDPIDGTSAFKNGTDEFAVLVALWQNNELTHGFIYWPRKQEWMIGEQGTGAIHNGQPLKLKLPYHSERAELDTLSWLSYPKYWPDGLWERLLPLHDIFGMRIELRYAHQQAKSLILGEADVSIDPSWNAWDIAAGFAIYQAMGGHVAYVDGSSYRPGENRVGIICAPTREIWQATAGVVLRHVSELMSLKRFD